MRKLLAIVVCKLGRFVGKLIGKGSSMPGKFALKICPDILKRVQLPPHIIAVTGSNGKTSTVEMIATVLRSQGKNVIYNAEGSNQVEGVTTLILTHATLGGKVNADVLLLESDERYAAHSFKYFHPTEFVITNLYRDQLPRHPPRYGADFERRRSPVQLFCHRSRKGEVVWPEPLRHGHRGPHRRVPRRRLLPGVPRPHGIRLRPL